MTTLFLILSFLTIVSALTVVLSPSPIYAVLSLVACFFSLAALFLVMGSPFLAAVQVIVYAGAVMVLFLFTLMMMNLNIKETLNRSVLFRVISLFLGALLIFLLFLATQLSQLVPFKIGALEATSIKSLGKTLFTLYTLPFEIASVLFLSAVVCVVMLGQSQQGDQ